MDIKKLKEQSKKVGLSEGSLYVYKVLLAMIEELRAIQARVHRHFCRSAKRLTTVGGAAVEEFEVQESKPGFACMVMMEEQGASPVRVLSAVAGMKKITVTFDGDPADDHKISYAIFN